MTSVLTAILLTAVVTMMVMRLNSHSKPSLWSIAFVAAVVMVLAAMLVLR